MATTYVNVYATLAQFKEYHLPDAAADTNDDSLIIEKSLEAASRYIDEITGRTFYPRVETRSYDAPDGRQLWLDDDLLVLTTLTNGDGNTIAATEYILEPKNVYPKYAVRLTQATSEYFETDDDGNSEQVIDVLGTWGCHDQYSQRAWATGSTLNEAGGLNATDLTGWTMTSGTLFDAGQIIKVDSELAIVTAVSTNEVTVLKRGENGSTGATHANGATVYIWQPMKTIYQATLAFAVDFYKRRFGVTMTDQEIVNVDQAQKICEHLKRIV